MSLLNTHYISSTNLYFSSDKADVSYGDSRKLFQLRKPLNVPKGSHLMLSLSSFNAPFSFYQIREGINDSFKVSTYYLSAWVELTVIIDEGNQQIGDIIRLVNIVLAANTELLRTLMKLYYNYTTSKFYITTTIQMDTVLISEVSCFKILGTNEDTTTTFNNSSLMTLPNIADISGTSCLYVVLRNRNIQNENSHGTDGVIAQINIEVPSLNYIYYKPIEMLYFETSSDHVNSFDISILDENMNQIDFNGGVWRVGFTLHYNYDKEVILPKQKKILENEENNKKETIEKN